jgi:hypothetical protein
MRLELWRTWDAAPVQYTGTMDGRPFSFRARWNTWSFVHGSFVRQAQRGDGPFAASAMPFEEAERIICRCAEAYVETTKRDV